MRKFLVLFLVLCWGFVGCESEEAVVPGEDASLNQTDDASDNGDPDADNGDPDADNGDPDADNGDPDADNGDPDADNGDPDADNGDPDADNGDPDADNGDLDAGDLEPGQCLTNDDCEGADVYCDRPPGCTERGECTTIPTDIMCSMVVTPYCDCNGESQQSPTGCVYDAYRHLGPCTVDD